MARKDILDSGVVKGLGILLAGGTVSLGLSIGLILYIWNESQVETEAISQKVGEHSAKISEITTSQAVVIEKLSNVESKLDEFRADFKREIERASR